MGTSTIQTAYTPGEVTMTAQPAPICGQHHVAKEWCPTTFEYSDEGITIRVPNVYAWVCPASGEASFLPETVDELIATVRELLETARRARERRSVLTQYVVSVGPPGVRVAHGGVM